jgi:signal transduction histidine kinase
MELDSAGALDLAVGSLELLLAGVVLRQIGRFGRAFPWLAALMVFFLARAADRIYAAFAQGEPLGVAIDGLLIAVLLLFIVGLERTANALQAAQDDALHRRDEYARALRDYKQLARHRLANPLTAIRGGIQALREIPELDPETQQQLLDAVDKEARRLEKLALEPAVASAEEQGLEPRPRIETKRTSSR